MRLQGDFPLDSPSINVSINDMNFISGSVMVGILAAGSVLAQDTSIDPSSTPVPTAPLAITPAEVPVTENVSTNEAPIPATAAEIPVKARKEPTKALDQKGKIENLDSAKGTFTVEGVSFVLSKKGKVFIDGAKKHLSDLKAGDLVAVVYFSKADGTNLATRVIKGHSAKKKTK